MATRDWISLVEAGYSLDGDDQAWLDEVHRRAVPLFERGTWPTVHTFRFNATSVTTGKFATKGPSWIVKVLRANTRQASPALLDRYYRRSEPPIGTFSEEIFPQFPEERSRYRRQVFGLFGDLMAIRSHTGQQSGLVFTLGLRRATKPTALESRRWKMVASHLGAGLRLRAVGHGLNLDSTAVEAVLDGGGRILDLRGAASEVSARDKLREAAKRIDAHRSQAGRRDPDAAMDRWEALVDGRWSLVDHFDSDQRRFVIALKNDPEQADPRGLSARERQVAEYVGLGHSSKYIAYTLGVTSSGVTNCTASAQKKLGLSSRAELASFFSPTGLRARLSEASVLGESFLIGSYSPVAEKHLGGLTEAERSVLLCLLQGSTNADIAQRRGTSERTVANQVQAVYRKFRVASRSELATLLQNPPREQTEHESVDPK